jgi:hypothetical protein
VPEAALATEYEHDHEGEHDRGRAGRPVAVAGVREVARRHHLALGVPAAAEVERLDAARWSQPEPAAAPRASELPAPAAVENGVAPQAIVTSLGSPMHTTPFLLSRRFSFLCAAVLLLGTTACSRHEREDAQARVKDAYQETKAAVVSAWDRVKAFTFEQRDKFTAHAKELSSNMDAQLSKLRAEAAEEKASESRRAAWAELKNAEADYKQKVAALGTASADTWESAKQNVIAAWDRLQVAYYRARSK